MGSANGRLGAIHGMRCLRAFLNLGPWVRSFLCRQADTYVRLFPLTRSKRLLRLALCGMRGLRVRVSGAHPGSAGESVTLQVQAALASGLRFSHTGKHSQVEGFYFV